MLAPSDIENYERDGYYLARGLFSPAEVDHLREHYMELRARGAWPGDFAGVDPTSTDPLQRFPRMIHMHRWDAESLDWLLDAHLGADFMPHKTEQWAAATADELGHPIWFLDDDTGLVIRDPAADPEVVSEGRWLYLGAES